MRKWRGEDVFAALPEAALPLVVALIESSEKLGVSLYLVGGPVRDLLLERPVLDVDLMVAGQGDIDAEALCREIDLSGAELLTHDRFGTATLSLGDASVDVATLRRESYSRPGALPKVEAGTLEEDLLRRDFSINALALPLCELADDDEVRVIDLFDGLADLEQGVLRVLHERSFHDDPTRALRAARFVARLGFRLTRRTRSLLRDALRDGVFGSLSGDRLRREFEKIFVDARHGVNPAACLGRLDEWHVLPALEPGLNLPREAIVPLRRLGKLLCEPEWRAKSFRPWASGLALWLAPLPVALRRRCLQRLSVRGDLSRRLAEFPSLRDRLVKQLERSRGRGAADAILHEIDEERLHALHASCTAPLRRRIARWAAEDRDRPLPVNGRDLTALSLAGPAVGKVLSRIRSAYLDGEVANREEALALARELERRSRSAAKRKKPKTRPAGDKQVGRRRG